jgi:arginyl-tRNA synthetase
MVASIPPGNSVSGGDPWAPILEGIVRGLVRTLASLGAPLSEDLVRAALDTDGGPEGDVAFPAHRAAALVKSRPEEFAAKIASSFPPSTTLASVASKGAYVNFTAHPEVLISATLGAALSMGQRWGEGERTEGLASVEHTSANPTGPFHIGRVRNAIIGDTFARILRASGTAVTTQYYVDDMGRQAAQITWIWSKSRNDWPAPIRETVEGKEVPGEKPDHYRGRPYPAVSAYLKDHSEAREEVARLIAEVESGDPPPLHRELAQSVLDGMLASLARLGIRFDQFVWESDFVRDGSVERVLERLTSAPHAVREDNGAWAIDTAGYGLPKDSTHVVVARGDGTSLYVTRDIAFHLQKFGRFARVIDVLGADHILHARTLEALLAEVGESRRPEFILYAYIHAPDGGKMSARAGTAVYLDDLLAEAVERARREVTARREDLAPEDIERIAEAVATGAVRYHVVRVAPDKPVAFRWEDALSFEGRSGPFLQYSYARASSVLRKAELVSGPFPFDATRLNDPEELALVRVLSRFPRVVAYAARTTHVHAVAGFAHDVADQFNRFYHAVPVLRSEAERESRIALVAATRQTLGNALDLLGVPRLETM